MIRPRSAEDARSTVSASNRRRCGGRLGRHGRTQPFEAMRCLTFRSRAGFDRMAKGSRRRSLLRCAASLIRLQLCQLRSTRDRDVDEPEAARSHPCVQATSMPLHGGVGLPRSLPLPAALDCGTPGTVRLVRMTSVTSLRSRAGGSHGRHRNRGGARSLHRVQWPSSDRAERHRLRRASRLLLNRSRVMRSRRRPHSGLRTRVVISS